MASNITNAVLAAFPRGSLDLDAAGDDVRALLVDSSTTVDTEKDGTKLNLADFTTLGEPTDDTGYSRQTATGEAVAEDDANDRAEVDIDDLSFPNNGDGANAIVGVVIYKHVDGTDANDVFVCFLEFSSPVTLDGTTLDVTIDAEGYLQFSQAA